MNAETKGKAAGSGPLAPNQQTALTRRQEAALPVFARDTNIVRACKTIGISKTTYYEWNQQQVFRDGLRRLREELVAEGIALPVKLRECLREASGAYGYRKSFRCSAGGKRRYYYRQ